VFGRKKMEWNRFFNLELFGALPNTLIVSNLMITRSKCNESEKVSNEHVRRYGWASTYT
jgi:hypothetical protein